MVRLEGTFICERGIELDIPLLRQVKGWQQGNRLTLLRARTQSFDRFVALRQERNMILPWRGRTQRAQLHRAVGSHTLS